MYVQCTKELRDQLSRNVIACGVMGSHAHGLNDADSDVDRLFLYYDPCFAETFCWEANGWQYKNNGVDENYQEIRHFIRNVIIGDSPADYEAMKNGFHVSDANAMHEILEIINNLSEYTKSSYSLAKSYLGYMKKDLNHAQDMINNGCPANSRELMKKFSHIHRAQATINHILNPGVRYEFTDDSTTEGNELKRCRELKSIPIYDDKEQVDFIRDHLAFHNETRSKLNEMLELKVIFRRMNPRAMRIIDGELLQLVSSLSGYNQIDYGDIRYEIVENGATFQYKIDK